VPSQLRRCTRVGSLTHTRAIRSACSHTGTLQAELLAGRPALREAPYTVNQEHRTHHPRAHTGTLQAELLAGRPVLREALSALAACTELAPLLAGGPSCASLARRAAAWQRAWHPRRLQQLKEESAAVKRGQRQACLQEQAQRQHAQSQQRQQQQPAPQQLLPPPAWRPQQQPGQHQQQGQPLQWHGVAQAQPMQLQQQHQQHLQQQKQPQQQFQVMPLQQHMQPLQVVLPNGQLGLLLPLVSAPPTGVQQSWQPTSWPQGPQGALPPPPQQLQTATPAAVPGPVPPPRPPPRPPAAPQPPQQPQQQQGRATPAKRPSDADEAAADAAPASSRQRLDGGHIGAEAAASGTGPAQAGSNQAAAVALRARLLGADSQDLLKQQAPKAAAADTQDLGAPPDAPPATEAGEPAAALPAARPHSALHDELGTTAAGAATTTAEQQQPSGQEPHQQRQAEAVPECVAQLAEARDDSEVVFLGTGAAEPSKYRGASAIHLRSVCIHTHSRSDCICGNALRRPRSRDPVCCSVACSSAARLAVGSLLHNLSEPPAREPSRNLDRCSSPEYIVAPTDPACLFSHRRLASGGGLLMDAGEGCMAQLTRCYGGAGAATQAAALAAVWLSHKHADHMLGLPGLLAVRPASAPPLLVIGAVFAAGHFTSVSCTFLAPLMPTIPAVGYWPRHWRAQISTSPVPHLWSQVFRMHSTRLASPLSPRPLVQRLEPCQADLSQAGKGLGAGATGGQIYSIADV